MTPIPFKPGGAARGRRLENLRIRAKVLRAIRGYFDARDFIEVSTPVRLNTPALELHIDAEPAGDGFLRTSPELHMKRLLADGVERIYQIGPCFRKGERGPLHRPEFTMLEWYRADADYRDILADTKGLVVHVAKTVLGRTELDYQGQYIDLLPWERMTVEDAFVMNAGWNPVTDYDEDRFDVDLVDKVEPALPRGVPVVLTDYPAEAAALARLKPENPAVAERFELYIAGIELANAYSELTDAAEQEARFKECADRRAELGKVVYPMDEEFLAALRAGLPRCGGIALGIDRLVMLLADAASIEDVVN